MLDLVHNGNDRSGVHGDNCNAVQDRMDDCALAFLSWCVCWLEHQCRLQQQSDPERVQELKKSQLNKIEVPTSTTDTNRVSAEQCQLVHEDACPDGDHECDTADLGEESGSCDDVRPEAEVDILLVVVV